RRSRRPLRRCLTGTSKKAGASSPRDVRAPARAERLGPVSFQVPTRLADLAPTLEGLREGHLIGVLEVAADGQPAGDAGDAHAERAKGLREVQGCPLALDIRVRRRDALGGPARLQPREQLPHLEIVRADAVER